MIGTYFKFGALIEGLQKITSSGGNTQLTIGSDTFQKVEGTQPHTVTLPDAQLMPSGRRFEISNRSIGAVTVNDFTGATIHTLAAGEQKRFRLKNNATQAGSWIIAGSAGAGGGSAGVTAEDKLAVLAALSSLNFDSESISARLLKYNPEEVGSDHWRAVKTMAEVTQDHTTHSISGFVYIPTGLNGGGSSFVAHTRYGDDSNFYLGRTNPTTQRRAGSGFALGGNAVISVGTNVAASLTFSTTESYSPETNAWTAKAAFTGDNFYTPASFSIEDLGYQTAGRDSTLAVRRASTYGYDPAGDFWFIRASVGALIDSTTGAELNGFGYRASGNTGAFDATVEKFNPVSNSWKYVKNLSTAKFGIGLSSSVGTLIGVGGDNGSKLNENHEYRDDLNFWFTKAVLPVTRRGMYGASINETNHFFGGQDNANNSSDVAYAYKNSAMVLLGTLKHLSASPTSVLCSVGLGSLSNLVPVQVRTDGDNWNTLTANQDSILRLGETFAGKLRHFPLPYVTGGTSNGGGGGALAVNEHYNVNQNTWASKQVQAAARYLQSGFMIDGKGYVLAGQDSADAYQSENKYYDEILNAFTNKAATPSAHSNGGGNGFGGYGYFYNAASSSGDATRRFTRYDGAADSYLARTTVVYDVFASTLFNQAGRLWLHGGRVGGSEVTNNTQYDVETDTWLAKTVMSFNRTSYAGFSLNGKNYVAGGLQSGSQTNALETYDPNTDAWTHSGAGTGDLPVSIGHNQGFVHSGFGYSVGGFTGTYTAHFHQFNPASLAWVTKTNNGVRAFTSRGYYPAPYRRYEMRVGVPAFYAGLGSWALVSRTAAPVARTGFGFGLREWLYSAVGSGSGGQRIDSYNMLLDYWKQTQSMPTSYFWLNGSFALLDFGYMIGESTSPGVYSGITRQFDPTLQSWATKATMTTASYPAGAPLNGFGYAMGGFSGTILTTIQKYNQATNAWAAAGNLSVGRYSLDSESAAGFIYLGGNSDTGFEQYSDAAQTTVLKASVPHINTDGGAGSKGDKFYYFRNSAAGGTVEYDTQGNYWVRKVDTVGTYYRALNMFEGNFFLAGGGTGLTTTEALVDSLKNAVIGAALEVI